MNILERTIEWGPRYTKFAIDSEQLILLSEIDSYLLSGPHIATLDANLTGAASVRALVDHHADLSQRASLLRNIELLLGANVLVASRARQLTETVGQNYRVPVPSITPRSEVLRNGHLEIKLYSDFDVAHDVVKSLSNIASTHRLTIAVVDDYLDPRLAELNAQHLANGYPWGATESDRRSTIARPIPGADISAGSLLAMFGNGTNPKPTASPVAAKTRAQ